MADVTKFPGQVQFEQSGDFTGVVTISDTTAATSKTTGALKVAGGIGVEKELHVGLTSQFGGLMTATGIHQTAGTDLANAADTITLTTGDHGKSILCLVADAAKVLRLPEVGAEHVGTQIKIIQNVDLVSGGSIQIDAKHGSVNGTFATNSYAIGVNGGRPLAATRPADANNRVTITGAGTNSAWGIASVATFTAVAANEWHFAIHSEPLGTGNDAIAFSTA